MLNPFPIQFLALLAYAILRVFVGSILVYLGVTHLSKRDEMRHTLRPPFSSDGLLLVWALAGIELIIGVMFIVGYYTQIAAILGIVLSLKLIILRKRFLSPYIPPKIFYVLLFAASFCLFITGAGAFAFDLPI